MTSNPHREDQPNPDALRRILAEAEREVLSWPSSWRRQCEGIAARRGQRFGGHGGKP